RQMAIPFARLLSIPHVNLIMTMENRQIVWEALQVLYLTLIRKQLVYTYEVEQWYISVLGSVTDEETAVEIAKASCSVMLAYHQARIEKGSQDGIHKTAHQAEFSLLLSVLTQRFSHNTSVSSLLTECFRSYPRVIIMSDDSPVD
ncbi:hypothetical protein OS493_032935, partial [Desmophyllum pertusum]